MTNIVAMIIYTAANGAGMEVSRISQSIIKTPHKDLVLKEILHVPNASRTLLLVHRIALGNNDFLEFHPFFYQGSGHEESSP